MRKRLVPKVERGKPSQGSQAQFRAQAEAQAPTTKAAALD